MLDQDIHSEHYQPLQKTKKNPIMTPFASFYTLLPAKIAV